MLTTTFLLVAFMSPGQASGAGSDQDVASLLQTAAVHSTRNQHAKAEECYRKVLNTLGDDHEDSLKTVVLLASAIAKQGNRSIDACEALEEALAKHRSRLGDDNADVQEVLRSIVGQCNIIAWTRCTKTDATEEAYATAEKYAQRAVELNQDRSWSWLLALAKLRHGDAKGSMEAMQNSLREGGSENWIGQYYIMAMVESANGDQDAGRDWYAAGCEWMSKERDYGQANRDLRRQAARMVNMSPAFSPADWSREEYLACFDRLVRKFPHVSRLVYRRGVRHAAGKDWAKAVADFSRAAELNPNNFRYSEAIAAVNLFTGTPDARSEAARKFIRQWKDAENPGNRMDVVVMCSLSPDTDLDRKELLQVAEEVLRQQQPRDFLNLGKGMALYRCGRFEEAVDVLPEYAPETGEKTALLALLFRTMTHHQVGDEFASKRMLKKAQSEISELIGSPEGALMRFQDRPVVWCMVQMALKEAEELIE
jgi:tetratricopeptide (TPR) repeat protein